MRLVEGGQVRDIVDDPRAWDTAHAAQERDNLATGRHAPCVAVIYWPEASPVPPAAATASTWMRSTTSMSNP